MYLHVVSSKPLLLRINWIYEYENVVGSFPSLSIVAL